MKLIILILAGVVTAGAATLNIRRVRNAAAPPTPTNVVLSVFAHNHTNTFLTWGNSATNYQSLTIDRSTNATDWTLVTNISGAATNIVDVFTWTNSPVYYRIKATGSNLLESLYNDTY